MASSLALLPLIGSRVHPIITGSGLKLIFFHPQLITELQCAHSPRCILGLLSHADQTQSCSVLSVQIRASRLERVRAVWLGNEDV